MIISSFGMVATEGVPYPQALTNVSQTKDVRNVPPVEAGIMRMPVQTSIGEAAERGDTGHQGGNVLTHIRDLFWPRTEKNTLQTEVVAHADSMTRTGTSWDRSGLDGHSVTPYRIPRIMRPSMGLNAGLQQHASTQSNYRAFIPPPVIASVLRGPRSVSGITGRMASADTAHIPAVFVPRSTV